MGRLIQKVLTRKRMPRFEWSIAYHKYRDRCQHNFKIALISLSPYIFFSKNMRRLFSYFWATFLLFELSEGAPLKLVSKDAIYSSSWRFFQVFRMKFEHNLVKLRRAFFRSVYFFPVSPLHFPRTNFFLAFMSVVPDLIELANLQLA